MDPEWRCIEPIEHGDIPAIAMFVYQKRFFGSRFFVQRPIGSMYGISIYTYIYHVIQPNLGKYTVRPMDP